MEVIHRLRPYPDNRSDLTRISVSALPGICYFGFCPKYTDTDHSLYPASY